MFVKNVSRDKIFKIYIFIICYVFGKMKCTKYFGKILSHVINNNYFIYSDTNCIFVFGNYIQLVL